MKRLFSMFLILLLIIPSGTYHVLSGETTEEESVENVVTELDEELDLEEESDEDVIIENQVEPIVPEEELNETVQPKFEESNMQLFSGDLNADIDISPVLDTVLPGKAAGYKLVMKVTGSQMDYTNATLVVDLPITNYTAFTQDVSELKIDGVIPIYNSNTHQLIYEFDEIKSGRTYETIIKVDTVNGISPNGESLTAKASFTADNLQEITDEAVVNISGSTAVSTSKRFIEVEGNPRNLAFPNSITVWEIKVSVPKLSVGQTYLNEGVPIVITDTLPSGLTYVAMESGSAPSQVGNKLTWTFPAPTIASQDSATDELFSTTLKVRLRVNAGTVDTEQVNNVTSEVGFINKTGELLSASASHAIYIVDSGTANGDIEGTWYVPNHFGPSNGTGGIGSAANRNPDPVVTEDAVLQFTHGIAPLTESRHGDFQAYKTIYKIDSKLIFKELKTPGRFIYRPNSSYPNGVPLKTEPVFNIKAKVNGIEVLLVTAAEKGRIYTRYDLGLGKDDVVSEIYYDFTTAPAGMLNVGTPQYFFDVKPGSLGEVKNVFDVTGVNGVGQSFANQYNSDPLAGPRTAQIGPKPTTQPPIATVGVELLNHNGGEITAGENRMKIELTNTSSSTSTMSGPMEGVVLLPSGVTLNQTPNPSYTDEEGRVSAGDYVILDNDYNGSGRQLVKVTWDADRLRIGKNLTAELDVIISEGSPNTLRFDVYGFSEDAALNVPVTSGNVITDTILQSDDEDLNNNGVSNEPRLKSGNIYLMRGKYDLQTEKLIKGPEDAEYSKFTIAKFDDIVKYKLKMTNTTGKNLSTMTLIDVLPSIGDLGITDNISRGSQFDPILHGPITIPPEWEGKVKVFYSKAKNPERDDLTRHTQYPDTTLELTNPAGAEAPNWVPEALAWDWDNFHSFKIELIDGNTWIKGQDIEIDFEMKIPAEADLSEEVKNCDIAPQQRAAWNSFAVATDHGQPVEPERVGVAINCVIDIPVEKVWVGDENNLDTRPDNIEVELLKDGTIIDDVVLGDTNDWEHVFEGLDKTDIDGNVFEYTVNEIEEEGYNSEVTGDSETGFTVTNTLILGSIEIIKYAGEEPLEEQLLAGAKFELRDLAGNVIAELTTDDQGFASYEGIPLGSYKLIEVESPDGYVKDATAYDVEIVFGSAGEALTFIFYNKPIEKIDIPVEKIWVGDENHLDIRPGFIEVELLKDETVIDTVEIDSTNDWKHVFEGLDKTDKDGNEFVYEINEVAVDEYDSEIIVDPEDPNGYVITNTLKVGAFEITKVDGKTGEIISTGAEFELQDSEGNVVTTGTTDEDGKVTFGDLLLGSYKLIETKAPTFIDEDGNERAYHLLTKPIDIEITESGQVEAVSVENFKSGWNLPSTDGIGTYLFYSVGFLLMLMAIYFVVRRKNKMGELK